MTLQPCAPRACMACKSAWMPAPPPESDPAMVHTIGDIGSTADVASIAVVALIVSIATAELIALLPTLIGEGTVTKPDSSCTQLDRTSTASTVLRNMLPPAGLCTLYCCVCSLCRGENVSNFLKCNPGGRTRFELWNSCGEKIINT